MNPASSGYQTVERALTALEWLGQESAAGVAELAELLSIDPSSASRLLKTLSGMGYALPTSRRGTYRLGPKVLALGEQFVSGNPLVAASQPILDQLAVSVRASAHLVVSTGSKAIVVAKAPSPERIQVVTTVGWFMPMHASAAGQVLLAFCSPELHRGFAKKKPLKRYTERTITKPTQLVRELELTRKRGFALEREQEHEGIGCIGAPIRDGTGETVAALSISGPLYGTPFRLGRDAARVTIEHAECISKELGYRARPTQADAKGKHHEFVSGS